MYDFFFYAAPLNIVLLELLGMWLVLAQTHSVLMLTAY
jgi:hypothetical protein